MTDLHIIWFQSDLRVHDQAALRGACMSAARDGGAVLALAILPERETLSQLHYDALTDLREALAVRDVALHIRYGEAFDVLSELHHKHRIVSLHCHEPHDPSAFDRRLEAWTLRGGIALRTYPQFRPSAYAGEDSWLSFVSRPRLEAPEIPAAANVGIGAWPSDPESSNAETAPRQGRKRAIGILRSFLPSAHRPDDSQDVLTGESVFAELETYLRLGTVSVREVWQAAQSARHQYLAAKLDTRAVNVERFLSALQAFACQNERKPVRTRNVSEGGQLTLDLRSSDVA